MKKNVPLAITATVGITMIVVYFIPHAPFGEMRDMFSSWYLIIFAAAILLGILNLARINLEKIYRRREGWQYSIVLVAGLFVIMVSGFVWGIEQATPEKPFAPFFWIFENLYIPMSATMFSLLGFFVASASYRAFRARNIEATLLLVAAFIVMLGRVPLGHMLSEHIPELAGWIMNIPNKAGMRAIYIGIALGIVSTSLRIILGIERSHLRGVD
jgi:hypothetical protein